MSDTVTTGQVGSNLQLPWREFISRTGSTEHGSWSTTSANVSMTIDINWSQRGVVIPKILGYAYVDNSANDGGGVGAGSVLSRILPMQHPYWPWLYATDITDQHGVNWTGKADNTYEAQYPQGSIQTLQGSVSQYGLERYTIRFQALPYDVVSNSNLFQAGDKTGGEWNRYVISISKPTTQFFSFPQGAYQFSTGNHPGTKFDGPVGIRTMRRTVSWTWMLVPESFIFNASGFATNIEPCVGKINSAIFGGYPIHTLYLDSVDYEPIMFPVSPLTLGYQSWHPPRGFNVRFNFVYFNPDPVNGDGWNSAPDRGDNPLTWRKVVAAPVAGGAAGNGGGTPYQDTNFATMFTQVLS